MTDKKVFKRSITVILSFLLIVSNAFVSFADTRQENDIDLYYANIDNCICSLNISGIKANCSAILNSKKEMNLKIKMELQKKKSSGYETVETWTKSQKSNFVEMSESRNINVLCTYRLKVTFTAGSETEVVYRY